MSGEEPQEIVEVEVNGTVVEIPVESITKILERIFTLVVLIEPKSKAPVAPFTYVSPDAMPAKMR